MQLRRLFPDPGVLTETELADALDLGALAPDGRPYVVLNMVASVDGRAALTGRTEALSSPADKAVFFALRASVDAVLVGTGTLRSSVDAVLVGTGTLRAERYGRLIRREERRAERVARGLAPEPIALVLSRSGDVPLDIPMFQEPDARPLVLTGDDADPQRALERVAAEHGVRSVLCEGGPHLNAGLFAAGVVDELFLTISPLIAATPEVLTIVADAGLHAPLGVDLVSILESEGMLFLRYRIRNGR